MLYSVVPRLTGVHRCLFWRRADMGLLDLMALQDKLPGLLLYSVALGGYDGDTLLQRGSVQTVLSLATSQPYNLNFSLDPVDNHRVRAPPLDCSSQSHGPVHER